MAQSPGTTNWPSPMTTMRRPPARPASTRFSWPLHQGPTRPNCWPYFLKTLSATPQVHCQRLRGEGLLAWPWRHRGTSTSGPKRRRRFPQERVGRAPSICDGPCLSQPRTRLSAAGVRQPKSGGNRRPTIFPNSFCWRRRRPALSPTRLSGRPKAWSACSRASMARGAWC
jgi:hypothetical protein